MLIPGSKRVAARAVATNFRVANYFASANGAGPAGSATMTWACVFYQRRQPITTANRVLFSRYDFSTGTSGWALWYAGGTGVLQSLASSGGGVGTALNINTISPDFPYDAWVIMVATIANNVMTGRTNRNTADATVALVGYTAALAGTATRIGNNNVTTSPADIFPIGDCLHLNTFDGTGFTSAVFGNGLAGLIAMWSEDIQQGRYLTKPQGGAYGANDAYWSSRDVAAGAGQVSATWIDRSTNAVSLAQVGAPQSGSLPTRLA